MPKPKPAIGPKQRANFIGEIRRGTSRVEAAEQQELDFDLVTAAIADDRAFEGAVQSAEEEAVRGALIEAALAGNIPAIHLFYSRFSAAKPPRQISAGGLEVNRIGATIQSLIRR